MRQLQLKNRCGSRDTAKADQPDKDAPGMTTRAVLALASFFPPPNRIPMSENSQMKFVEMTGRTLGKLITVKELHSHNLMAAGVNNDSIVRVNQQGDIEVRRQDRWDIIGGLLGKYDDRIREVTGLDWA